MKILVIEDETRISNLLRIYLEREMYQVVTEENGISGLEKALSEQFNLVILDVLMPGKDGYQVLQELRLKQDTPVILLSAQFNEESQQRGIDLGANAFIAKPFSPKTLVAKVKEILS